LRRKSKRVLIQFCYGLGCVVSGAIAALATLCYVLCRGHTRRFPRPMCCPTSRRFKNLVRENRPECACSFFPISSAEVSACQPKDAHQNLGRENRTRHRTCCLTGPIFSTEKLEQHLEGGNQCVRSQHYVFCVCRSGYGLSQCCLLL